MRPKIEAYLKYINRIRNAEKKDYALRFAIWLERSEADRETVPEPQPFHLGVMAAQAVRTNLYLIARSL